MAEIQRKIKDKYGVMTTVSKVLGALGGFVKRNRVPYGDRGGDHRHGGVGDGPRDPDHGRLRRASGTGAVLVSRSSATSNSRPRRGSTPEVRALIRLRDRPVRSRSCVRDRRSRTASARGCSSSRCPRGRPPRTGCTSTSMSSRANSTPALAELVELRRHLRCRVRRTRRSLDHDARPRGQRVLPPMTPRSDGGSEGRTVGHDRPR